MSSIDPMAVPVVSPEPPRPADAGEQRRTEARRLAQEFEALLLTQMLRDMRQAMVDEDDPEESGTREFGPLTGTIDAELGRALAASGGFGLSSALLGAIDRLTDPSGEALSMPRMEVARPTDAVQALVPGQGAAGDVSLPSAVTSGFGWRSDPLTGAAGFHSGVDLRMAYGEDVRTVGEGRVVFSGERGGYGNMVAVMHPDGRETRYAHLAETLVHEGDQVQTGQVLGRSGSSGRATGPHLHFEVVMGGRRVDPTAARTRTFPIGNSE